MTRGCGSTGCSLLSLMLALGLLVASADRARAESAQKLLEKGIQRFNAGDLEESLDLLDKAKESSKESRMLGRICLYMGLNHAILGKKHKARTYFNMALFHDPSLELDPNQFKKVILALFEEVRASLRGELSVKADHDGALVFVDGKKVGQVPFYDQLPVGKHKVTVRSVDGKLGHEEIVLVARGKKTRVMARLIPLSESEIPKEEVPSGVLVVRSAPPGATVFVDDKESSTTPARLTLAPGDHSVSLVMKGRESIAQLVSIKQGEERLLTVALKPDAAPASDASVEKRAPAPRRRIWTWVAGGGALVCGAVATGLYLSARSDHDEYTDPATSEDRVKELEDGIDSKLLGGNVMLGVAGGLVVTAVVLFFLEGRSPDRGDEGKEHSMIHLRPLAGRASGFSLSLTF